MRPFLTSQRNRLLQLLTSILLRGVPSLVLLPFLLFGLLLVAHAEEQPSPKTLLILVQGSDGHPPQTHEYVAGGKIVQQSLKQVSGLKTKLLKVSGSKEKPDKETVDEEELVRQIAHADGVMLFVAEGARWLSAEPRRQQAFAKLTEKQGGLFALHWAIGTKDPQPIRAFVQLFGVCHGGPDRKYKVLETTLSPLPHPATQGIKPFPIRDEFYYQLKTIQTIQATNESNPTDQPDENDNTNTKPTADTLVPLLTAEIDQASHMVAWGWQRPDGGRSAGFSGLHFHANWKQPEYRQFVLQTILWTMQIEVPDSFPPELDPAVYELE